MKIIIAGSRTFTDYKELVKQCNKVILKLKETYKNSPIEIISGTARGADSLGELYAKSNNYKLTRMPANWDKYGKYAGIKRNREMAEYAIKGSDKSFLIAFIHNNSNGTKNMIEIATSLGIPKFIFEYVEEIHG